MKETLLQRLQREAGEKFVEAYCVKRPASRIRWIRAIFLDDTDQIEKTLEAINEAIANTLKQASEEKRDMVREILEKIETTKVTEDELAHSKGETLSLKNQYNSAKKGDQEHIKTIAQKYGVDLSE